MLSLIIPLNQILEKSIHLVNELERNSSLTNPRGLTVVLRMAHFVHGAFLCVLLQIYFVDNQLFNSSSISLLSRVSANISIEAKWYQLQKRSVVIEQSTNKAEINLHYAL